MSNSQTLGPLSLYLRTPMLLQTVTTPQPSTSLDHLEQGHSMSEEILYTQPKIESVKIFPKLWPSSHSQNFVYTPSSTSDFALSKLKVIRRPWSLTLDDHHTIVQTEL